MTWGSSGKSEAGLGRAWALKLSLPASQLIRPAMNYGMMSKTSALLTRTSVHFLRSSLAQRQRLRGQEYPTRYLQESLACLRMVSLLHRWRAVAHTSSALAVAYTIIQSGLCWTETASTCVKSRLFKMLEGIFRVLVSSRRDPLGRNLS